MVGDRPGKKGSDKTLRNLYISYQGQEVTEDPKAKISDMISSVFYKDL